MQIASDLLRLHVANKNRRVRFYYLQMKSEDHKTDYLNYAPKLLARALPKAQNKNGKDLLSIVCDHRSDLKAASLQQALEPVAVEKGFVLHEQVVPSPSNFHTVGLMYADIVGYLLARIDTITTDSEFLENIPPEFFETNGKLRKLKSSTELMANVQRLKRFVVLGKKA